MAEILGLPLIHLDRHYWHPGWVKTTNDEWDRVTTELAQGDLWVMDGNYSGTINNRLPRADAAVLLDVPPWRCVPRVLKRYFSGERPDLPEGCTDKVMNSEFLWYIVSYRWRSRPRVLARVANHPHVSLTTLRSDREVERFVSGLARPSG